MAYFKPIGSTDKLMSILSESHGSSRYRGVSALKNSDILAGLSIIAGDVSSFPLVLTDSKGTRVDMGKLSYLLNKKATSVADARSWRFTMVVQAILTGNSYSRILRDPYTGEPLEFVYYTPSEVTIEQSSDYTELEYVFSRDGKIFRCRSDDVFHLKFFTHNTITGRSPLLSLDDEIGLQEAGRNTLQRFFKSGMASGILKLTDGKLNAESKKKIRKEFEETRDNSQGHTTIVLDSTMDFKPLEVDTNVLQLINSNNYSTAQIAKCLRIPAYKLGVNSPNQSVEQLNRDYVNNDLVYYMNAFISEANLKLLSYEKQFDNTYAFDTSRITDVDTKTKIDNVKSEIAGSLSTINEGRRALGKEAYDDPLADKLLVSLNHTFLDTLMEKQETGGDSTNEED